MPEYKAVLFDFDGTLINTNDVILGSWQHLYKEVTGESCTLNDVRHTFGEILRDTVAKVFPLEDPDEMVKTYRFYAKNIHEDPIDIFPGIKDMLIALRENGIKPAIVTSRYWASLKEGNYNFPPEVEELFETKVTCEDTDKHKPDPEPINICLAKLGGLKPHEVLYVGDTLFDLYCAHNAGVEFVFVNWSAAVHLDEFTDDIRPEYVANDPRDIVKIALGNEV
jgi:pyrophosphatase PpaX